MYESHKLKPNEGEVWGRPPRKTLMTQTHPKTPLPPRLLTLRIVFMPVRVDVTECDGFPRAFVSAAQPSTCLAFTPAWRTRSLLRLRAFNLMLHLPRLSKDGQQYLKILHSEHLLPPFQLPADHPTFVLVCRSPLQWPRPLMAGGVVSPHH